MKFSGKFSQIADDLVAHARNGGAIVYSECVNKYGVMSIEDFNSLRTHAERECLIAAGVIKPLPQISMPTLNSLDDGQKIDFFAGGGSVISDPAEEKAAETFNQEDLLGCEILPRPGQ